MKQKLSVPLVREAITTLDNSVLVDTIADFAKQLKKHDLVRLQEWEKLFVYCAKHMPESTNAHVKEQITSVNERISEMRRNIDYIVNTQCSEFVESLQIH